MKHLHKKPKEFSIPAFYALCVVWGGFLAYASYRFIYG